MFYKGWTVSPSQFTSCARIELGSVDVVSMDSGAIIIMVITKTNSITDSAIRNSITTEIIIVIGTILIVGGENNGFAFVLIIIKTLVKYIMLWFTPSCRIFQLTTWTCVPFGWFQ